MRKNDQLEQLAVVLHPHYWIRSMYHRQRSEGAGIWMEEKRERAFTVQGRTLYEVLQIQQEVSPDWRPKHGVDLTSTDMFLYLEGN